LEPKGVAAAGAVPLRSLGLGRAVGLDVGGKMSLGFRSLPLCRWAFAAAPGCGFGPSMVRPMYYAGLVAWSAAARIHFSFGAEWGWFRWLREKVFIPGYRASRVYVTT